MKTLVVEKSDRFKSELKVIVEFIALDSIQSALNFYDEITSKILDIPSHPYIYRKKDDDENLRELIYKGYTIPFEIDKENHKIIILGIFNQNLWN
ncbi:MAG: type II toxin-antitoxin system RelE/ParE family toxin [Aliarcobacter sp.]|nr:type II toxin-antitoxin system RelE/ParE family toxin [Aliarcobacter sp.]